MDGIYIPVIGLVGIVVMFITFSILNSRNQREVHQTIRAALEKGTPLTADLVSQLNTNRASDTVDLRRGIIIISIGIAALMAGFITGSLTGFATISVFPIFMGLGFLLVWRLERGKRTAS